MVGRSGDSNWTFRPPWISVLRRCFLLASRLQRRFSLCQSVLERLSYEPCLNASRSNYIYRPTDKRLQDPRLCGCTRRNASFLSPKRLDVCRSNVQLLSPKRPTGVAQMIISKKHTCCVIPTRWYFCLNMLLLPACNGQVGIWRPILWTSK